MNRGGMEPGEGRRRGSGSAGGNAGRAGRRRRRGAAAQPGFSRRPLSAAARGTAASAGPPPRGLPSPSPAAAPLHRAAARIPARPYPPAPGSERPAPRGPRPGWGSWVPARYACLPACPPPLRRSRTSQDGRPASSARGELRREPEGAAPGRPAPAGGCQGPRRGRVWGWQRRAGRAALRVRPLSARPVPRGWAGGTPAVLEARRGAAHTRLGCPSPPGAAPARHEAGSGMCRVSPARTLGSDGTPSAAGPGMRLSLIHI